MPTKQDKRSPDRNGLYHPREVAKKLGVSRATLRRCDQDFGRTAGQIADLTAEQPQWLVDGRAAAAAGKQEQREIGARRERRYEKEAARAQRMLEAYKDGRGL